MEYKILCEESPYSLEGIVNDYIKKGWIPQGGVFSYAKSSRSWCQAMIKN